MTDSDAVKIQRALISVSDKTDLISFGQFLHDHEVQILSTGGTAKSLKDANIPVQEVAEFTNMPEMMGGRVKTLHPNIHGGILARHKNKNDAKDMILHGIQPIDLVVINLYPFEETMAAGGDRLQCIENIDIGGPAMIRSAAKNHERVAVITNAADYELVTDEMSANQGATSLDLRRKLARLAFARTASYDVTIANWLDSELGKTLPAHLLLSAQRSIPLRYGENPHQKASLFLLNLDHPGIGNARQVQGKPLSYNNLNDADAALELVAEFDTPAAAIIKHANPCGVALGTTTLNAFKRALECDPVSAFGGIIAFNRPINESVAAEVTKNFSEVVIAPDASDQAQAVFATKKNLRLLLTGATPEQSPEGLNIKSIAGGFLVQESNQSHVVSSDLKVVTARKPTEKQLEDLLFAFRVCKHVKSNAIVYAKEGMTIGIGAGQMSRVDSARMAAWKAKSASKGANKTFLSTINSVAASDAFFPFPDGILGLIEAGAEAIIQPGGSIRDQDIIEVANKHNIAMVFTGLRNFRH
jgi:phosphoribosylaminoimidazolecarboxamide formyltransferase/IMP cyclohydrolase